MKKINYFLLLTLFMVACGGETQDASAEQETNTNSTEINAEVVKEEEPQEVDFEAFWAEFVQNASNKEYLVKNIDFPFMDDVYEKEGKTQEAYEASEQATSFFENMAARNQSESLDIEAFVEGAYMNGDLNDFLMKKYGNLDNIYMINAEASPSGFVAYFKVVGGQYKFVGYESTQTAD